MSKKEKYWSKCFARRGYYDLILVSYLGDEPVPRFVVSLLYGGGFGHVDAKSSYTVSKWESVSTRHLFDEWWDKREKKRLKKKLM